MAKVERERGNMRERRRRESWSNKERNTVVVNTIGTEPTSSLVYAPGLEHHHLPTSKLKRHRGRLDIYIYIN